MNDSTHSRRRMYTLEGWRTPRSGTVLANLFYSHLSVLLHLCVNRRLFDRLKECRNRIAHEMAQVALPGGTLDHLTLFPDLVVLLRKIETWWIVNVEIPTNEEFDGKEIDEAGIIPGPIMTVKMMLDIALESASEAAAYLKALETRQQGQPPSDKSPR